jgi:hypothetical protein
MKGPVPASMHDATVFRSELEAKTPPGKKSLLTAFTVHAIAVKLLAQQTHQK